MMESRLQYFLHGSGFWKISEALASTMAGMRLSLVFLSSDNVFCSDCISSELLRQKAHRHLYPWAFVGMTGMPSVHEKKEADRSTSVIKDYASASLRTSSTDSPVMDAISSYGY